MMIAILHDLGGRWCHRNVAAIILKHPISSQFPQSRLNRLRGNHRSATEGEFHQVGNAIAVRVCGGAVVHAEREVLCAVRGPGSVGSSFDYLAQRRGSAGGVVWISCVGGYDAVSPDGQAAGGDACLENPGVRGKAQVSAGHRPHQILWNNPANITTKAAPNYDESVEITP